MSNEMKNKITTNLCPARERVRESTILELTK